MFSSAALPMFHLLQVNSPHLPMLAQSAHTVHISDVQVVFVVGVGVELQVEQVERLLFFMFLSSDLYKSLPLP